MRVQRGAHIVELGAYLAVTAAATLAGARGPRRAAAVTKPLPIAMLAARVAATTGRRPLLDSALLAGAVGFSAAGDRLMLLEEFEIEPDRKDAHLRAGASLFAGAQLCYAASMARLGGRTHPRSLAVRMAILSESALVAAVHRPAVLARLSAYGNTLALMSALSAGTPVAQPRLRIGGWLFLASDLAIINRRHLITDPRMRTLAEIWVLGSYFAAQACLLTGLSAPGGRNTRQHTRP